MYIETVAVMIVIIGLITINGEQGKQADKFKTLTQDVWDGSIIREIVIGIERQHAARKRIHHITAWRFHDNISDKMCRQGTVIGKHCFKCSQFLFIWQFIKEQKISNLLITETII